MGEKACVQAYLCSKLATEDTSIFIAVKMHLSHPLNIIFSLKSGYLSDQDTILRYTKSVMNGGVPL